MLCRSHSARYSRGELFVSTVFAVQLLFDSQDTLGVPCGEELSIPFRDLQLHWKHLALQYSETKKYHNPFVPEDIEDDAYEHFTHQTAHCSYWLRSGPQWRELKKNPQVASHKLFKVLTKDRYFLFNQQPPLCAELKHLLYAEWHAAGMRLESQIMSICMMAHIYVRGLILRPNARRWPDMEIVLFSQSPEWLFYGGQPKTLEEHWKKFAMAFGASATLHSKDMSLEKLLKVGKQRMRKTEFHELRDSSAFGDGIFHRGNNGEVVGGGNALCEDVIGRLFKLSQSSNSESQPWGRLAQHFLCDQPPEPELRKEGMSAMHILEALSRWAHADTAELFFDWVYMHCICNQLWIGIDSMLKLKCTDWKALSQPVPAMDPALEIIMDERFLNVAQHLIDLAICELSINDPEGFGDGRGDSCLTRLTTYHRLTARNFLLSGTLNFRTLLQYGLPGPTWNTETERGLEMREEELKLIETEALDMEETSNSDPEAERVQDLLMGAYEHVGDLEGALGYLKYNPKL